MPSVPNALPPTGIAETACVPNPPIPCIAAAGVAIALSIIGIAETAGAPICIGCIPCVACPLPVVLGPAVVVLLPIIAPATAKAAAPAITPPTTPFLPGPGGDGPGATVVPQGLPPC